MMTSLSKKTSVTVKMMAYDSSRVYVCTSISLIVESIWLCVSFVKQRFVKRKRRILEDFPYLSSIFQNQLISFKVRYFLL